VGGTTNQYIPACTEVNATGQVVFQMQFNDPTADSYRAFRCPYPSAAQAVTAYASVLADDDSYSFPGTGVSLVVDSGGGGYNRLDVTNAPCAPVNPQFNETAPCLLPLRINFAGIDFQSALSADVSFSSNLLSSYVNPTNLANLTIYYRSQTGAGLFAPLQTYYDPVANQLITYQLSFSGQGADFGEVAFGYPDVAQVPYPPILNVVETWPGVQPDEVIAPAMATNSLTFAVNQQQPICLSWSPVGFAGWYYLQIATTPDFASPVVDDSFLTNAFYVWDAAAPTPLIIGA